MASESLNAMLGVEKGFYLVTQGKTPEEATTAVLETFNYREKAFLILDLSPEHSIRVLGSDPEGSGEDQQWYDEQAHESLLKMLTPKTLSV